MGEPVTKERLNNYVYLQAEYYNNEDRLARLKNDTELPAMQAGDGSQRSLLKSSRMEKASVRKMDKEKKLESRQKELSGELTAIEKAVESLLIRYREVLKLRYLDGDMCQHMKWGEVAESLYGSNEDKYIMSIWRIHGRAIEALKELGE